MRPVAGEERWEVLEKIGAYAAGELEGEEAREAGLPAPRRVLRPDAGHALHSG
jgi:hypothetical protein